MSDIDKLLDQLDNNDGESSKSESSEEFVELMGIRFTKSKVLDKVPLTPDQIAAIKEAGMVERKDDFENHNIRATKDLNTICKWIPEDQKMEDDSKNPYYLQIQLARFSNLPPAKDTQEVSEEQSEKHRPEVLNDSDTSQTVEFVLDKPPKPDAPTLEMTESEVEKQKNFVLDNQIFSLSSIDMITEEMCGRIWRMCENAELSVDDATKTQSKIFIGRLTDNKTVGPVVANFYSSFQEAVEKNPNQTPEERNKSTLDIFAKKDHLGKIVIEKFEKASLPTNYNIGTSEMFGDADACIDAATNRKKDTGLSFDTETDVKPIEKTSASNVDAATNHKTVSKEKNMSKENGGNGGGGKQISDAETELRLKKIEEEKGQMEKKGMNKLGQETEIKSSESPRDGQTDKLQKKDGPKSKEEAEENITALSEGEDEASQELDPDAQMKKDIKSIGDNKEEGHALVGKQKAEALIEKKSEIGEPAFKAEVFSYLNDPSIKESEKRGFTLTFVDKNMDGFVVQSASGIGNEDAPTSGPGDKTIITPPSIPSEGNIKIPLFSKKGFLDGWNTRGASTDARRDLQSLVEDNFDGNDAAGKILEELREMDCKFNTPIYGDLFGRKAFEKEVDDAEAKVFLESLKDGANFPGKTIINDLKLNGLTENNHQAINEFYEQAISGDADSKRILLVLSLIECDHNKFGDFAKAISDIHNAAVEAKKTAESLNKACLLGNGIKVENKAEFLKKLRSAKTLDKEDTTFINKLMELSENGTLREEDIYFFNEIIGIEGSIGDEIRKIKSDLSKKTFQKTRENPVKSPATQKKPLNLAEEAQKVQQVNAIEIPETDPKLMGELMEEIGSKPPSSGVSEMLNAWDDSNDMTGFGSPDERPETQRLISAKSSNSMDYHATVDDMRNRFVLGKFTDGDLNALIKRLETVDKDERKVQVRGLKALLVDLRKLKSEAKSRSSYEAINKKITKIEAKERKDWSEVDLHYHTTVNWFRKDICGEIFLVVDHANADIRDANRRVAVIGKYIESALAKELIRSYNGLICKITPEEEELFAKRIEEGTERTKDWPELYEITSEQEEKFQKLQKEAKEAQEKMDNLAKSAKEAVSAHKEKEAPQTSEGEEIEELTPGDASTTPETAVEATEEGAAVVLDGADLAEGLPTFDGSTQQPEKVSNLDDLYKETPSPTSPEKADEPTGEEVPVFDEVAETAETSEDSTPESSESTSTPDPVSPPAEETSTESTSEEETPAEETFKEDEPAEVASNGKGKKGKNRRKKKKEQAKAKRENGKTKKKVAAKPEDKTEGPVFDDSAEGAEESTPETEAAPVASSGKEAEDKVDDDATRTFEPEPEEKSETEENVDETIRFPDDDSSGKKEGVASEEGKEDEMSNLTDKAAFWNTPGARKVIFGLVAFVVLAYNTSPLNALGFTFAGLVVYVVGRFFWSHMSKDERLSVRKWTIRIAVTVVVIVCSVLGYKYDIADARLWLAGSDSVVQNLQNTIETLEDDASNQKVAYDKKLDGLNAQLAGLKKDYEKREQSQKQAIEDAVSKALSKAKTEKESAVKKAVQEAKEQAEKEKTAAVQKALKESAEISENALNDAVKLAKSKAAEEQKLALAKAKEKSDAERSKLQTSYDQVSESWKAAEEELNALKEANAGNAKLLTKVQELEEKVESQLEIIGEWKGKAQTFEEANKTLQGRLETAERERNQAVNDKEKSEKFYREQLEAETDNLSKAHKKEIKNLNNEHKAKINELNTLHAKNLKKQLNAKAESLNEAHLKVMERLQNEHRTEIKNLKQKHLEELDGQLDTEAKSLKKSHLNEINGLKAEHEAEINELNRKHAKQLKDKLAEQIVVLNDKLTREKERVEQQKTKLEKLEGVEAEYESLKSAKENLTQQNKTLKEENQELTDKNWGLEKDLGIEKDKVGEKETARKQLATELEQTKSALKQTESKLGQAKAANESLVEQLANAGSKNGDAKKLTLQNIKLKGKITKLEQENEELRKKAGSNDQQRAADLLKTMQDQWRKPFADAKHYQSGFIDVTKVSWLSKDRYNREFIENYLVFTNENRKYLKRIVNSPTIDKDSAFYKLAYAFLNEVNDVEQTLKDFVYTDVASMTNEVRDLELQLKKWDYRDEKGAKQAIRVVIRKSKVTEKLFGKNLKKLCKSDYRKVQSNITALEQLLEDLPNILKKPEAKVFSLRGKKYNFSDHKKEYYLGEKGVSNMSRKKTVTYYEAKTGKGFDATLYMDPEQEEDSVTVKGAKFVISNSNDIPKNLKLKGSGKLVSIRRGKRGTLGTIRIANKIQSGAKLGLWKVGQNSYYLFVDSDDLDGVTQVVAADGTEEFKLFLKADFLHLDSKGKLIGN